MGKHDSAGFWKSFEVAHRYRLAWLTGSLGVILTLFLAANNMFASPVRAEGTRMVLLLVGIWIVHGILHDRAAAEFFALDPRRVRGFLRFSRWASLKEFQADLHAFLARRGICDPGFHRATNPLVVASFLLWAFYPGIARYGLYPGYNGVAFGLVETVNFVLLGMTNLLAPALGFFGIQTEPVEPIKHVAIG
jgi:hypothetical protein